MKVTRQNIVLETKLEESFKIERKVAQILQRYLEDEKTRLDLVTRRALAFQKVGVELKPKSKGLRNK